MHTVLSPWVMMKVRPGLPQPSGIWPPKRSLPATSTTMTLGRGRLAEVPDHLACTPLSIGAKASTKTEQDIDGNDQLNIQACHASKLRRPGWQHEMDCLMSVTTCRNGRCDLARML